MPNKEDDLLLYVSYDFYSDSKDSTVDDDFEESYYYDYGIE